jgi:hypothetical protein
MPHLVFRVLDVGQGSANIIELREKEDILNTIVIDLGTSRGMSVSDGPTADAMFTLLNSMDDPKIGALVLSHSDSDHINLIKPVLDRFAPPGPRVPGRKNLEISWVRYGGPADKYVHEDPITKEKTNVIELVKSYCLNKAEVQGIPFADTSFDVAGADTPWHEVDGVKLFSVIGNAARSTAPVAPPPGRKPTVDKGAVNTRSIVVLLEYDGNQFVVTGDATGVTMRRCNAIFDNVPHALKNNVFMLTAPHHGSITTANDVKVLDEETPDSPDVVRAFARTVSASAVTASAGQHGGYRHPSATLLDYLWTGLDVEPPYSEHSLQGRHFFTAYFDRQFAVRDDGGGSVQWPGQLRRWYSVQTKYNVYTTAYLLDPEHLERVDLPPEDRRSIDTHPDAVKSMPERVSWSFWVVPGGRRRISLDERTPGLLKLREAMMTGAPLPEVDDWPPPPPWEREPADSEAEVRPAVEPVQRGATRTGARTATGFDRLRRLT